MNVIFGDDQMPARTSNAAHNFVVMQHFVLNLIRLDAGRHKCGLKVRRLIAAASESHRAQLLSVVGFMRLP